MRRSKHILRILFHCYIVGVRSLCFILRQGYGWTGWMIFRREESGDSTTSLWIILRREESGDPTTSLWMIFRREESGKSLIHRFLWIFFIFLYLSTNRIFSIKMCFYFCKLAQFNGFVYLLRTLKTYLI